MKTKYLACDVCSTLHSVSYRHWLQSNRNRLSKGTKSYCSLICKIRGMGGDVAKSYTCLNCSTSVDRTPSQVRGNTFCTLSCAAIYRNAHKTKGTRRSKLEVWLEGQLCALYPELDILYNNRNAINSELDFYIPSLKLAFELNGLFHYEPIFGESRLNQIQTNDNRKFQACIERGIELCIIDTSGQKYFKESTSKKYLDIIINLINYKLSATEVC